MQLNFILFPGYRQDIFILKKEHPSAQEPNLLINTHLSPIAFQYDEWDCNQSSEFFTLEELYTGESFSEFERHNDKDYAHFDGDIRENFSSFERHEHEDFMNLKKNVNEEFLNLEHSNECFSDCEEPLNEVFSNFES